METGLPRKFSRFHNFLTIALLFSVLTGESPAYSVLTHEQLIDFAWSGSIRPLLLARYPGTTAAALREAHAYAYGGCAIQDLGYYPFGEELFSDLTHYVRSGDFVAALFRDARNVNEYAFAIGALSHYLGDSIGHAEAINRSTAIEFPKLENKFGPIVTYDQSPHAHVRTEYGFDIEQLSKREFAPPAYMNSIGFRVPVRLLERAFRETYGIKAPEILGKARPALRSYRRSVRSFIPVFSKAETVLHRKQFPPDLDNDAYRIFHQRLATADYERHWSRAYRGPGFVAHVLAVVIKILPKVGPISLLAIKIPDRETEGWYVSSVNHTVDVYRNMLDELRADPNKQLALANRDLDTGDGVKPGAYPRTDETYARLLDRLTSTPARRLPLGIRQDVLDFYSNPDAPINTRKDRDRWKRVLSELEVLQHMTASEKVRSSSNEED
jgi:Dopey and related predicted leucine zipper transcription factors